MYRILFKPFATILSIKPIPAFKLVAFPKGDNVFRFTENKPLNSAQKQKQENQAK